MQSLSSSQDFVKALKAPSDPPAQDGSTKVEIARQAWDQGSFYVPRKGEVISDWVLSRLLKDKNRDPGSNPILDCRYWKLLVDVFNSTERSVTSSSWLTPLLLRTPFAPIIIAFLDLLPNVDPHTYVQTTTLVRLCFATIWPVYVPKTTVEVFLDCFGASLRAWKNQALNADIAHICIEIASSFRRSLSTANTKKKVYTIFTQNNFADWIIVLSRPASPQYQDALEVLYSSGVECIFNLDILRDSKSESMLFDALDKVDPSTVLPVLPRLYQSYIQVIKKHRGALFSQGTSHNPDSLEDLREASMRFFASCQSLIKRADSTSEAWRSTASLLDSIDRENIFSIRQSKNEVLLKGIVISILTELTSNQEDIIAPVLECLTCIARVDYRLIEPMLSDVFSRLLLISNKVSPAFQLLDLVLQYHGKTRSVHRYIEVMILSAQTFDIGVTNTRRTYDILCHSALLHLLHLDQLAKYTHDFLPLGQTIVAVQSTVGAIESQWQEYSALQGSESNGNPRKRRKTNPSSETSSNMGSKALGFFAAASLATIVLSSFSTDSVPDASKNELESMLIELRACISAALSKMLKIVIRDSDGCWASQIVLLAMLRILYAIGLRQPGPQLGSDSKVTSRMLECLQCDLLPELKLEILRNLFKDFNVENQELDVLEQALVLLQPSSASHIMHMIIQRWLPAIDLRASENQLKRIIRILMEISTHDVLGKTQTLPAMLIAQALSSAEFWELPNFRGTLLAYVDDATNTLENESSTLNLDAIEVKNILAVYSVLLLVPGEYLNRPLKIALFRRAFTLDMLLSSGDTLDISDADLQHTLSVLRVFASRVFPTLDYDYSEQSNNAIYTYLRYLLVLRVKALTPRVVSDTLDLATVLLAGLLKRSENSNHKEILLLTKLYLEVLDLSSFTDMEISSQCFNRTVKLLSGEYKLQSFSSQVLTAFNELLHSLLERLLSSVCTVMTSSSTALEARNILEGWRHVLIFRRWLGLNADTRSVTGDRIPTIFALPPSGRSTTWSETCIVVYGILLEEIQLYDDTQLQCHLANMVAIYVIFSSAHSECCGAMDESLSPACSRLLSEPFNFMLELVADSLEESNHSSDILCRLVHLATLLLRNPPPNTLQITQNFTARCINAFNNHPVFARDARSSVLEFLTQRCRDRPAALRLQNVSGIWSFIAKISAPSETHDLRTSVENFHAILSISTALIRLRRDLVVLTLPHLGMILRYLILSMQCPRPNLGSQQTALVSRSLPLWMNLNEHLGSEEAKALSRLLESLTTKTLVKTHSSASSTAQKAESLAKPFSKHAAYVLNAYVEALNNPLCILPVEVRKELQPGLYALCGMLTDYSRDALMASSTDAGEKASLKSLWKAYEKQRYVGKG